MSQREATLGEYGAAADHAALIALLLALDEQAQKALLVARWLADAPLVESDEEEAS